MKSCLKRFFYLHLCLLVVITLNGCSSKTEPESSVSPAILDDYRYGNTYMRQMNYSVNDEATQKKEEVLEKDGVKIVSVGQQYKLIIPGKILFYPGSPRIMWKSYAILNNAVSYIQDFNKVNVKVAGITQATGKGAQFDRALSLNRARVVANYLWEQEIGAGILYIRGYVEVEQPDAIEISFRSMML